MFKRWVAKLLGLSLSTTPVSVRVLYKDGTYLDYTMQNWEVQNFLNKISRRPFTQTFRFSSGVCSLTEIRSAVIVEEVKYDDQPATQADIPSPWVQWIKEEEARDEEEEKEDFDV